MSLILKYPVIFRDFPEHNDRSNKATTALFLHVIIMLLLTTNVQLSYPSAECHGIPFCMSLGKKKKTFHYLGQIETDLRTLSWHHWKKNGVHCSPCLKNHILQA